MATSTLAQKKNLLQNLVWETGGFISIPASHLCTPARIMAQVLCFVYVFKESYCASSLFEKLSSF